MTDSFEGINRLQEYLRKKTEAATPERIIEAQQKGAEYMRDIMRGRNSPKRKGTMLASFTFESDTAKTETTFGWGAKGWYGRLKESGHNTRAGRKKKSSVHRVKAQPHLRPTFEANKTQVFQLMTESLDNQI